jgi:hypothetical protein
MSTRTSSSTTLVQCGCFVDEKAHQDLEDVKCWCAAQWKVPVLPALKLRESLILDVKRWRGSSCWQLNTGVNDESVGDKEKSQCTDPIDEVDDCKNPVRFSLGRKFGISISIVLMTAIR